MRVRGTAPHRTATAAIPASSDTWREAHHRLFEYLRTTTPDKSDANLEDLQPLYQAVAHGCHAGCHQAAFDLVLYPRIHRGTQFYSTDVLSAIHTELATISLFIGDARCAPVDGMTAAAQGWLFNELGFGQLAVLRLADASVSIQKALDIAGRERDYHEMSRRAANLYLIRMATGELDLALKAAQEIERAGRLGTDSVFADGGAIAATAVFACRGEECDVETILRAVESRRSELEVSFFYATALLAQAERLTWQHTLHAPDVSSPFVSRPARSLARLRCEQVIHIAEAGCCRFGADGSKFPYGIEHLNLALGKFFLHAARNDQPIPRAELLHLVQLASAATTILREANRSHYLPYGLLTRAWLRAILDLRTGPDSAQADLDEAHEIALRGPMPLHLADIHLHRARLFHREAAYPWSSPGADLAEARRLIVKHHYLRRKGELEDAEAVIRP